MTLRYFILLLFTLYSTIPAALHDAAGSITAIVGADGEIAERYFYDVDGRVKVAGQLDNSPSFGWRHLWRQMAVFEVRTVEASPRYFKVYTDRAGRFYAPSAARWLQPDAGAEAAARNEYYESSFSWYERNAAGVVQGAKLGIAAGVAFMTGGLAAPLMTLGVLSGYETRYMRGDSEADMAWGVIEDATLFSSVKSLATGRDSLTGESLSGLEYGLHGTALFFGGAAALRHAGPALQSAMSFAARHRAFLAGSLVLGAMTYGDGVSEAEAGLPMWLKRVFKKGKDFDKANRPRYMYNEVEVSVWGKKYVLDSYDPIRREIVSRKLTQLAKVKESTALKYLAQFVQRYSPGTQITKSVFNSRALHGKRLRGEMILEVPIQRLPVPQSILDAANARGISIRDVARKVY